MDDKKAVLLVNLSLLFFTCIQLLFAKIPDKTCREKLFLFSFVSLHYSNVNTFHDKLHFPLQSVLVFSLLKYVYRKKICKKKTTLNKEEGERKVLSIPKREMGNNVFLIVSTVLSGIVSLRTQTNCRSLFHVAGLLIERQYFILPEG